MGRTGCLRKMGRTGCPRKMGLKALSLRKMGGSKLLVLLKWGVRGVPVSEGIFLTIFNI